MSAEHAQRCGACGSSALARRVLGLELEAHAAVFLPREIRGERPAGACRHELEEIRLAALQQLLHLLALDRPLQDGAARPEVAGRVDERRGVDPAGRYNLLLSLARSRARPLR